MQIDTQIRSLRGVARAAVLVLAAAVAVAGAAPSAHAADEKAKTERTTGRLVKYDKAAQTITVKDKGKETVLSVTAEGSVLTRTTVTKNAKPAKLDDLAENAPVIVYWRMGDDGTTKMARKIDMPNVPRELEDEAEGGADAPE